MPAKPNQLIFFVGLHGTGKTTLGRWLQATHGWKHFSVGDFARKARRHERFKDVPLPLLIELARQEPNARMNQRLVDLLLQFLREWNRTANVVCDGFPSEPLHLALLPAHARIIHVTCQAREERLALRSESTRRIWTPGDLSLRDRALPLLLQEARARGLVAELNNDGDMVNSTRQLAKLLGLPNGNPAN